MKKALTLLASSLMLLACSGDKSCTEMDCNDELRINLYGDTSWMEESYLLTVETAEGELRCFPVEAAEAGGSAGEGGGFAETMHDCEGDLEWLEYEPPRLILEGTPDTVLVTMAVEGEEIASQKFKPEYEEFSPNGEGCPDDCQQSTIGLTVD